MTGMGEQFTRSDSRADAVRRINKVASFLAEHPGRLRETQQAVANLTSVKTSPDGLVTVRVDSSGQLTEVDVAPDAFARVGPQEVARIVVDIAGQAAQDVLVRRVELTRSLGRETAGWSGPTRGATTPARADPMGGRNTGRPRPAGPSDEDDMPQTWLVDTDL